jgi:CRP/FNR family transcriptional regulator
MPDWISRFSGLNALPERLRKKLTGQSRIVTLKKGARVFGQGSRPDNLLMLLEGTVRVQQMSEAGREIVLYRVQAGESCVMTTACLLAYDDHNAEGVAETEVKAAAIPRTVFEELISTSKEFRQFVFQSYSRRITDLFFVIDELAFRRVDIRLAEKLVDLQGSDGTIKATHAQLAAELGTAREVISRQLQDFQRKGWVALSRGAVRLDNVDALLALSSAGRLA